MLAGISSCTKKDASNATRAKNAEGFGIELPKDEKLLADQSQFKVELNWGEGKKYLHTQKLLSEMKTSVPGSTEVREAQNEVETQSEVTLVKRNEKSRVFKLEFAKYAVVSDSGPGMKQNFDLTDAVKGAPIEYEVSDDNDVKSVKGIDQLKKQVREKGPKPVGEMLAETFDKDKFALSLKQSATNNLFGRTFKVGETWDIESKTEETTAKTTYQFDGWINRDNKKLARISYSGSISFKARPAVEKGDITLNMTHPEVPVVGVIYMDPATGIGIETQSKSKTIVKQEVFNKKTGDTQAMTQEIVNTQTMEMTSI